VSQSDASTGKPLRPKLTLAVPFPVYPPVGGGQQRVFSLYRHVARAFAVELVTLAEAGAEPREQVIAPGMREIRIPKSARHQEEEARIAQEVGGVPLGDIAMSLFAELTPDYGHYLARSMENASLVVACHPYSLPAIRKAALNCPLVYDAHDVEYLLKQGVLKRSGAAGADLIDAVRTLEAAACRESALIFCCSDEDARDLRSLYGIESARVMVAPNGVDTDVIRFHSPAEKEHRKGELGLAGRAIALFVGSWHPPNLEAAEAVFEMAGAIPRVTFLLAGSQCLPLADRRRPDNVGLMGVVDEETLEELLAVADVALNPMLSGSGTNLKMATYLAAGLPVIATPAGARGYDLVTGEHAVISPLAEFPERIAQLLADGALAEKLACQGRRLAEQRYDWRIIASGVTAGLRSLSQLPVRATHPVEKVIDRVSAAIAELGVPERQPLIGQVAAAVAELALSSAHGRRVTEGIECSLDAESIDQRPAGLSIRVPAFPHDEGPRPPMGPEEQLSERLSALGLIVRDCEIDVDAYRRYVAAAGYTDRHSSYYPTVRAEKALEHYVAAMLLGLHHEDVFIDIASQHSPATEIYRRLFRVRTYRQDLAYPTGLHGDTIGGDAAALPVPDGFATKLALHCSFEHFEGDSDIGFVREAARVLRPGGAVCIVPLYLCERYTVQTDPTLAEDVSFEPDAVVHQVPGWGNRHGRFYDPEHLVTRIIRHARGMQAEIFRITNAPAVDPTCYARFALVLRRTAVTEAVASSRDRDRRR
jgi:glycosyltransferase involved in cell wall biosynthesis/SAM-dependent methyltransferase